jgi:hypothetical protein
MTITISPEAERRLRERAHAEGVSIGAYVEQLIREDEECGEVAEAPIAHHDPEFGEVKAALTEGLYYAIFGDLVRILHVRHCARRTPEKKDLFR